MGVYIRPDSKYYWIWLEHAGTRKNSKILIGSTTEDRKKSRAAADQVYFTEMLALGLQAHGLAKPDKPTITFADFAAWYDTHIVSHHRGKIREREILETLKKAFPCQLHEVTKQAVLEWRTARTRQTSAGTSNRELAVLRHLLNAAVPQYLEASPIAGVSMLRPQRTEPHVLTRTEERKLLNALTPADRALVICALDTLMRLSDVLALRRDQDRGGYLLVADPKVSPYQVPVSTRLRKALNGLPKAGPCYFAHRQHTDPVIQRSMVKNMLSRACEKAGIDYGRKAHGITFHGLRHTGTTRMVDAGVSLRIIQAIGGWKSMRQLERYGHPTEQAKRQAVEKISHTLRSRPKKKRRNAA